MRLHSKVSMEAGTKSEINSYEEPPTALDLQGLLRHRRHRRSRGLGLVSRQSPSSVRQPPQTGTRGRRTGEALIEQRDALRQFIACD